jgi:ribosomal protein L11
VNSNFMLKVEDAKLPDVQKALQQAGIKVRSIIEVFKEETKQEEPKK